MYYGLGDEIEDQKEALRLLYQAKSLNFAPAYTSLADYFMPEADQLYLKDDSLGAQESRGKALEILKEGAQKGHGRCYVKMSKLYSGSLYDNDKPELENVNKCWKKYFRSATFIGDDDRKWKWGRDWEDDGQELTRIDYARDYCFSAFLGVIPFDFEIREILLPLRQEITANIAQSSQWALEQKKSNPDYQSRVDNDAFLEFVKTTL